MLTAAVQAGHDNADAVGAACNSLDQAHQVLEVVVRGEVVLIAEQLVGNAVIARIDEDIQVVAAGRGLDQALGVAGLERGQSDGMMKVSTSVLPTSRAQRTR